MTNTSFICSIIVPPLLFLFLCLFSDWCTYSSVFLRRTKTVTETERAQLYVESTVILLILIFYYYILTLRGIHDPIQILSSPALSYADTMRSIVIAFLLLFCDLVAAVTFDIPQDTSLSALMNMMRDSKEQLNSAKFNPDANLNTVSKYFFSIF